MTKQLRSVLLGSLLCLGGLVTGCGPQTEENTPPEASVPTEVEGDGEDTEPDGEADAPAPPAQPPESGLGATVAGAVSTAQVDADGVLMLHPSKTDGANWSLGSRNPNTVDKTYFDMGGDPATAATENGLAYWWTRGHKVSYASGAPDGVTVRLNIKASGGTQRYTWKNGALTKGYISNPKDLKNLEATIYVRVRDNNGTHNSMSWKMRGGKHSSSDAALASCTEMSVPYGNKPPRAAREFDHPKYDYVNLTPKFSYQLQANRWLGVKIVSWLVPGGSMNQLYLDTDPFDTAGKPRNNFRLYSEWQDRNGTSTGRYKQAATWAGRSNIPVTAIFKAA